MKANLLVPVLLVATLIGCAHQSRVSSGEQQYREFHNALSNEPESVQYEAFLSSSLMAVLNGVESAEERAHLEAQSAFTLWLESEASWQEKVTSTGSCLTVMGVAPGGAPGMVAIGYLREDGVLKADSIYYQYLESADDFPSEALCPEELVPEFPY